MHKIGNFWVPDIDAAPGRNLERSEFGFGSKQGVQIDHLIRALELVPDRTVAVDGGANVGAWAKLMGAHFEQVHTFEPNPVVFECLARNIQEWGLSPKVTAYPNGISDKHEFVSISTKDKNARTVTGRISGKGNIECITIDSLNLADCSLLKLDVEGYEDKCLRGASETIGKFRPWIMIENRREKAGKKTPAELVLDDFGYVLVEKIGDDELDWLYKPA